MRRILPLLMIVLSSHAVLAGDDWPPRADAAFLADTYPSRDLALRAICAQLGDGAKITESAGKVIATSAKPDAAHELSVTYVDKPWAADWSAFTNTTRGNSILARSSSPCLNAGEAEVYATQSAVAELLPIVRQRLTQQYRGRRVLSDKALSDLIGVALRSSNMVSDRFVQRFSRPYGDVWYEAMLIDASPRKIDAIVTSATRLAENRIKRGVGIVLAFLLLLALTTVAYVLLNWLTKGYFAWRLRFAAMTTIVVALMTVLAIV